MIRQYVLENLQAPGDSLMFTCAIRDLHRQRPGEFITSIATRSPDIWQNNPYHKSIDRTVESGHMRIGYSSAIHATNYRPAHFSTGFCQDLSEKFGIRINLTDMRPDVYLTDAERDPGQRKIKGPYWVMMAGGKPDFTNKIWAPAYYQQTVDLLAKDTQIVQAGAAGHLHKPLTNVINMVGKTSFRDFMCLVYHAQGVICPITSGMHLAAAFNKPCVVIGGGREGWWWEAYTRKTWAVNVPGKACPAEFVDHTYLHTITRLPCCAAGGCWTNGVADKPDVSKNCKAVVVGPNGDLPKCMDMIRPSQVVEAVHRYMAGQPIPLDDIPPRLKPPLFAEPLQAVPCPVYKPAVRKPEAFRMKRDPKRRTPRAALPRAVSPSLPVTRPLPAGEPVHELHNIKSLTVCALAYGDYPQLIQRCLQSVTRTVDPKLYELRVGLNAVSDRTRTWINQAITPLANARVYDSRENMFKYPMMRRMFNDPPLTSEWTIWFDDDGWASDPNWLKYLDAYIGRTPTAQVIGRRYFMHLLDTQVNWVKQAKWYTGKDVDRRKGAAVTRFATGGWWAVKSDVVRKLDWPDPRLQNNGGDTNFGCACWQNGIEVHEHYQGIMISDSPRRGASQVHPGR